jgi:CheY-like chemotaxis protein
MGETTDILATRGDVNSAGASDVESPATTKGARVAVVLDDDRAREALSFQLSTAGFRVASFPSAHKFLADKAVGNFDCVVSDIFLPGMNGLELQRRLRETANFVSIACCLKKTQACAGPFFPC